MGAIYFHKGSSDENPVPNFCHASWCTYKKAEARNDTANYKHKNNLPPAVMDELKPTFKVLAKTQLLEKCLEGYTQNPNESLNHLIWKFCPKTKNHGLRTVETAVAVAVCLCSSGCAPLGYILQRLDIVSRCFAKRFFADSDSLQIITAQ